MTSNKPYLVRAMYEWICDNESTPYLYINTQAKDILVPDHLLADNPLILNISPSACQQLDIANEAITFQARFSGRVFDVYVPMIAVMAIVARENGQGMTFEIDALAEAEATETPDMPEEDVLPAEVSKKPASHLKIIK